MPGRYGHRLTARDRLNHQADEEAMRSLFYNYLIQLIGIIVTAEIFEAHRINHIILFLMYYIKYLGNPEVYVFDDEEKIAGFRTARKNLMYIMYADVIFVVTDHLEWTDIGASHLLVFTIWYTINVIDTATIQVIKHMLRAR